MKKYNEPKMNIVSFLTENVLTTSGVEEGQYVQTDLQKRQEVVVERMKLVTNTIAFTF